MLERLNVNHIPSLKGASSLAGLDNSNNNNSQSTVTATTSRVKIPRPQGFKNSITPLFPLKDDDDGSSHPMI